MNTRIIAFAKYLPKEFSQTLLSPETWKYLQSVVQDFKPRDINGSLITTATEPLSIHTVKDLQGIIGLLNNKEALIKKILPSESLWTAELKKACSLYRNYLNPIKLFTRHSYLLKLFYIFIFYHDIGKEQHDRKNHEAKGAEKFKQLQLALPENELAIIDWLIRYHGVYAAVDSYRRNNPTATPQELENICHPMFTTLQDLPCATEQKDILKKLMAAFNFIEGIQSDQFSWSICTKDQRYFGQYKYTDILHYYQ